MYRGSKDDECIICHESLVRGFDIFMIISNDEICYKCRSFLNAKVSRGKLFGLSIYSFYQYDDVSQLLIRFKDYSDISLGPIFLSPYAFLINTIFKDYTIVLVPSSLKMLESRGFNHLELMLRDIRLDKVNCLKKSDSIQRFSSDRKVEFKLIGNHKFDKIIIFDDVVTSANSLKAAVEILAPISNKIVLISVINNYKVR